MSGYIRLYRGWRDCDAFCDERLSEREAWLWLLENAAYRPAKRRNGKGEIITIERGQIHVSDRSLASAWDWDKKHVRRFLDRLSDCGMVAQSRDQSGTILSIVNYEKYQSPANDTGTGQGTSEGPAEDQPRTTHKEGKEGKEEPNGSKAGVTRASRIPDDWHPSPLTPDSVSGEIVAHRGQDWARRAFESFRNHWRTANGPNARKRDWQAAWANWVIEQDRRDGNRNGSRSRNGQGSSVSGYGRTIDATLDFIREAECGHAH